MFCEILSDPTDRPLGQLTVEENNLFWYLDVFVYISYTMGNLMVLYC